VRIVFVTCPPGEAQAIADAVLRDRLVACVNEVPSVTSRYWWKGKLERDSESLLIMKTRDDLVGRVITRIRGVHSYDVPEIITTEIREGNPDYLAWIDESCRA
jgi:periplasmic divalent cation tolerance protein